MDLVQLIVYNVSGTYTGISHNEETFPISLLGGACEVTIGAPVPFKSGSYAATSNGYGGACQATQSSMTDNDYTTGWASLNRAASQNITIDFGATKVVKKIALSGGSIPCWSGNAGTVSAYSNVAGLQLEYRENLLLCLL